MVKTINITLDDSDFEKLRKIKGSQSWTEFILTLLKNKKEERKQ